jgi:hypothetical protein
MRPKLHHGHTTSLSSSLDLNPFTNPSLFATATSCDSSTHSSSSSASPRHTLSPRRSTSVPVDDDATSRESDEHAGWPAALQPTTQYWTSSATRRAQYAEIDAASRGVRGVARKLLPSWAMPREWRRSTRLVERDGSLAGAVAVDAPSSIVGADSLSDDSDAASVRRFRIDVDEDETPEAPEASESEPPRRHRFGLWRRRQVRGPVSLASEG